MNINENDVLIVKDNSKRIRKSNAIKLPPQINESMIPKYVVYYKECYNREKMLFREFFKIEKHPKIKTNKIYTSSKSNKINILDKLEQIKIILKTIENNNLENNNLENNNLENNNLENNNLEKSINKELQNKEKHDEEIIKKIILPKYVSLKKHEKDKDKYYLIFDKKIGENRQTYKTLCNNKLSINQNLDEFIKKINEKYL